jgi:hypothetical protein
MTHTNLVLFHHLKYISIGISLFLTIRSNHIEYANLKKSNKISHFSKKEPTKH